MTVNELISLNQMITDIEITVRQNGNLLLDQLNIGPHEGIKPRYPTRVPTDPKYAGNITLHDPHQFKDAAYVLKSINSWDDGKDYWQVKPNRLPKGWGDLEVFSWDSSPASVVGVPRRQIEGKFRNVNFNGEYIRITVLPNGQTLSVPEPRSDKTAEDQLDGQMSIEDWDY